MRTVRKSSTTYPLILELLIEGQGVEGLSCTASVRDASTANSFLDFSDGMFKTSGWTTKTVALVDIGSGNYLYVWNVSGSSGVTKGKILSVEYTYAGIESGKVSELLEVDVVEDYVTLLRKHLTNKMLEAEGNPGTLTLKDDDDTTDLMTWEIRDLNGNGVVGVPGSPARRSKATGSF